MKRLAILLIFLTTLSLGGCFVDALGETCNDANNGCGDYEACCTTTQCRYLYDGQVFECDGTDCNDAAERLVDVMCDF